MFKDPKSLLRMNPIEQISYISKMNAGVYNSIAKSQENIASLSQESDKTSNAKEALDIANAIEIEKSKIKINKQVIDIGSQMAEQSTKISRINTANKNSCDLAKMMKSKEYKDIYCNIVVVDSRNSESNSSNSSNSNNSNSVYKGSSKDKAYAKGTTRYIKREDGKVEVRKGGTRAWRNK